jgi:hypothetical protein
MEKIKRKRGRPRTGRQYDSHGVYTITCVENSRIYVGGSSTVNNRICNHKCRLRTASPACVPEMLADFQMYGEGSFKFEIIKRCKSRTDFLRSEQELIKKYSPTGLLYNRQIAYAEKIPKRKDPPRGERFQIYLPVRQREWLEEKSKAKNLCRAYYLEILIDSIINNDKVII